jgi:hypothetical protein
MEVVCTEWEMVQCGSYRMTLVRNCTCLSPRETAAILLASDAIVLANPTAAGRSFIRGVLYFWCLGVSTASVIGCGAHSDHEQVYPVTGKVMVHGAPAAGARISYYPAAESASRTGMALPFGDVDSEGVYHLQSYVPGDGAPAGEYRVAITWLEPLPPGANPEQVTRKDRLAGKYSDPDKSKLTAKVEKGGGEIPPFELP